jgi:hypothetical protein
MGDAGHEHHPVNDGLPEPIIIFIDTQNRSVEGIAQSPPEIGKQKTGGLPGKQKVIKGYNAEQEISRSDSSGSQYPDEYPETCFITSGLALP